MNPFFKVLQNLALGNIFHTIIYSRKHAVQRGVGVYQKVHLSNFFLGLFQILPRFKPRTSLSPTDPFLFKRRRIQGGASYVYLFTSHIFIHSNELEFHKESCFSKFMMILLCIEHWNSQHFSHPVRGLATCTFLSLLLVPFQVFIRHLMYTAMHIKDMNSTLKTPVDLAGTCTHERVCHKHESCAINARLHKIEMHTGIGRQLYPTENPS